MNQIVNYLTYTSYKYNRGLGMTHEALVSIGVGNEEMKEEYEREKIVVIANQIN